MTVEELLCRLGDDPLTDGITLSGGEPFCQAGECAALARAARERGLNVWTYTGYAYEDLTAAGQPDWEALLDATDVLVDGPFIEALKSYEALYRGSSNQRLIDLKATRREGRVVLWGRADPLAHFTRPRD